MGDRVTLNPKPLRSLRFRVGDFGASGQEMRVQSSKSRVWGYGLGFLVKFMV